ncbi:MAG TPA: hypothetical protein PKC45_09465, partial [Gemmatales bacterium]|nr:hypothetical protein [Gemmatales bacterium]
MRMDSSKSPPAPVPRRATPVASGSTKSPKSSTDSRTLGRGRSGWCARVRHHQPAAVQQLLDQQGIPYV